MPCICSHAQKLRIGLAVVVTSILSCSMLESSLQACSLNSDSGSRASCRIRTGAADLQDRSHNHLDQRSKLRNSKNADGRTRTRIDSFRRRAPDPFGHIRKLRSQGSNLESLGSKPSVLPITPLRNVGGWGRIRTGCLWWFRPALFQNELPNLLLSAFCLQPSVFLSVSRYIQ